MFINQYILSTMWHPKMELISSDMTREGFCFLSYRSSLKIFINRLYSLTLYGAYDLIGNSTYVHCNYTT